ncbi:hypothetical protein [Acinetobacter sp. P1(2025)]|uniref:hypothetical protein n=1 Tax=Acinetobacter sp. P1(2025) TaxID=3446120 RepID=UPI003F53932E
MQTLKTSCSAFKLNANDQVLLKEALNIANVRSSGTVSECMQFPIERTTLDTNNIPLWQQLTTFALPFFGAIFYFLATNFIVFASLAFMFWVVVMDKFPKLGKTFFRQYLTCGAAFVIATAVMLPTISSVQVATLHFNAMNNGKLAIYNKFLCSSEHTFDVFSKRNAIPITSEGYRPVEFSNNQNGIVCFGRELDKNSPINTIADGVTHAVPQTSPFIKLIANIFLLALIPLLLVVFLNIAKKVLHRIMNR